jgi:hypothetical protein
MANKFKFLRTFQVTTFVFATVVMLGPHLAAVNTAPRWQLYGMLSVLYTCQVRGCLCASFMLCMLCVCLRVCVRVCAVSECVVMVAAAAVAVSVSQKRPAAEEPAGVALAAS